MSEATGTVLVVDDHPGVRTAVRVVLSKRPRLRMLAHAETGEEAVAVLEREPVVDWLCLDLGLPGELDGFGVLSVVRARFPGTRVVVLTGRDDSAAALRALSLGALGVVSKQDALAELPRALDLASSGTSALSPTFAPALASQLPDISPRERDVLSLIAKAQSNAEIASALGLGEETVKTHVSRLLVKLRANNRTHLAAIALRNMLTDDASNGAR